MQVGHCLCGAVKWRVSTPLAELAHCHCSMCRKAHGAPFATFSRAGPEALEFIQGTEQIAHVQASTALHRAFCGTCGSCVPLRNMNDNYFAVPLGNMALDAEGVAAIRAQVRIFTASAPSWLPIDDNLRQFDEYPRGRSGPPRTSPPAPRLAQHGMQGSCLCGAVVFEVTGSFEVAHNCHCSRCRRARSAVHTSNGFTTIDNVQFIRGEARLKSFKLPGAQHFTQTFCAVCGAPMPRKDPSRAVAVVPLGGMDDDPGIKPGRHIYVASKVPWYDLQDTSLPLFDERPT